MNIENIIAKINESMERLDIISTRQYIEDHMQQLDRKRHHLAATARELYVTIKQKQEYGLEPLTRNEVSILYSINMYASKFDIIGIRALIKAHPELWARDDIKHYFNEDAKSILQSMKVIPADSDKRSNKQNPLSC